MKAKKPQSKRRSTKMAQGLKKKAAAHNRKQKKLAKKDITWRSKQKKDPGIPSSFPYKERILSEMEERKRVDLLQKEARKQLKIDSLVASGTVTKEIAEEQVEKEEKASNSNRLSALLESAQVAAEEYEGDEDEDDEMSEDDDEEIEIPIKIEAYDFKDSSSKAFDKIYQHVVDSSDVILYVLDARDPEGSRSSQVEQAVLAHPEKRLLFVLNKIDLVPIQVLKKWQAHLKLSFPTLPLVASNPAPNAQTFHHQSLTQITTSTALLQALRAYANSSQLKRPITVGVVGYPNVGKSSVINALIARRSPSVRPACPVGTQAGTTTSIRKVKVDNKLKVFDSPGVIFPSAESKRGKKTIDEKSRLVLLNALPPKHIGDPVPAVTLLLKRLCKNPEFKEKLMTTYNIPSLMSVTAKDMVTDFLVHVARNKGRLNKGGIPDLNSAATAVIGDWRDGRIAGWTVPKVSTTEGKRSSDKSVSKIIVTKWAKEFSLEGLWDGNFGNEDAEILE